MDNECAQLCDRYKAICRIHVLFYLWINKKITDIIFGENIDTWPLMKLCPLVLHISCLYLQNTMIWHLANHVSHFYALLRLGKTSQHTRGNLWWHKWDSLYVISLWYIRPYDTIRPPAQYDIGIDMTWIQPNLHIKIYRYTTPTLYLTPRGLWVPYGNISLGRDWASFCLWAPNHHPANVDPSSVRFCRIHLRAVPEDKSPDSSHWDEIQHHTTTITDTSPGGQWVNSIISFTYMNLDLKAINIFSFT